MNLGIKNMFNRAIYAAFALAATASNSYAQNYDTAKKILEADKQVRDYQAAKAGGYDFIYNDTSTGQAVIAIVIIFVAIFFFGLLLYSWFTEQVQKYKDAQAEATKSFSDDERDAYNAWNDRRWRRARYFATTVACLFFIGFIGFIGREAYFEIKRADKHRKAEVVEVAKNQEAYIAMSTQRQLLAEIFEKGKIEDFEIGTSRNLDNLKIKFGKGFDLILFRVSHDLIDKQDYLTFNCMNFDDTLCEPLKSVEVVGNNVNKVTFIYCNDVDSGKNKPSIRDKLSNYVLTGFAIKYSTYEQHKIVVDNLNKLGIRSAHSNGNVVQVVIDDYHGIGNVEGLGYGIMRKIVGTKDLCVNM